MSTAVSISEIKSIVSEILSEMPQITKRGKDLYAGEQLLRNVPIETVSGNLVFIREPNKGGFIPEGWSVVYFMDSEESAHAIVHGDIPYLLIPQGTFYSGGSPILDVWKKKFQKPGHEHILGLLQANTMPHGIFLDMLSVRPGYQRNTIAQKMVHLLMQRFPEAEVSHSSPTDKGRGFLKKNQLLEPRYQTPKDREDMMDDQMEGRLDESFHDHAKLEAFHHVADQGYVFWFFRNGRPAGEIQMISQDGHMFGFGVERSLQGTGLGRAMLQYAFDKTGFDKLTFDSTAHAFYHKLGGERQNKGKSPNFVLYRNKLKGSPLKFIEISKEQATKYLITGPIIDPWPSKRT